MLPDAEIERLTRLVAAGNVEQAAREYCRQTGLSYPVAIIWVDGITRQLTKSVEIGCPTSQLG